MKLSELIRQVGDDNIFLQNILQSSPDITVGKKDGRISFYTDRTKASCLATAAATGHAGPWTGFVVWLPTHLIPNEQRQPSAS